MDITIKGKVATVSGSVKDVTLFGIQFLRNLNPLYYTEDKDFPAYMKQWDTGVGTFDVSLKETKAAFVEALKDTL